MASEIGKFQGTMQTILEGLKDSCHLVLGMSRSSATECNFEHQWKRQSAGNAQVTLHSIIALYMCSYVSAQNTSHEDPSQ